MLGADAAQCKWDFVSALCPRMIEGRPNPACVVRAKGIYLGIGGVMPGKIKKKMPEAYLFVRGTLNAVRG